jgi:hypothetical protein
MVPLPLPKSRHQRHRRSDDKPPRPHHQRPKRRLLKLSRQPLIKRHHLLLPRQK